MCKVQEKAKNERQNDDYATTNTNPNSSSHHDEAHHVRRRLSQTITSRSCLLIAIALASLSAHACDDTVELQVTCDSAETPWVVPSHIPQTNNSDETTPQMVTVGSCIEGRVKDVAQVKGKDINDNGIVLCSQSTVCYHLNMKSDGQINVKDCDNYDDPNRTYHCDNGVLKFRNDTNHDFTANDTCFSVNSVSHNYGCDGNVLTQTPCPNGCADDHKGCKQNSDLLDKCRENDTPICEGKTIKICKDQKWESTDKRSVCQKVDDSSSMYECQDSAIPTKTPCPLGCDKNGDKCKESCSNDQTKCAGDLKGRVDCNGNNIDECQYCYNESIENQFTSIEKLVCKGCEPNEYKRKESTGSTLNPMDEVCYNGKLVKFDSAKGSDFILFPQSNRNGLWEFALNVTVALPEGLSPNPPANQFQTLPQRTWRYYNCHNDAMKFLTEQPEVNNVNDFLVFLNNPNKCCDDDSYYITQTGYRYYSVEKCTNIVLYDTHDINNGKSKLTNFSAYAYTPELNGSIIGIEDDLLAKDYACLEAKDKPKDKKAVRRMFIKQKTNGEQQSKDGEPKHGIYKAFECPEDYKCDLKNRYKGLCISENENVPSNSNCSCNNNNTIMCGSVIIAACPKGTTPRIVGDSDQTSCDGQIFSLDQIRCVPDGKSTAKQ